MLPQDQNISLETSKEKRHHTEYKDKTSLASLLSPDEMLLITTSGHSAVTEAVTKTVPDGGKKSHVNGHQILTVIRLSDVNVIYSCDTVS